jgi:membrane-associated phospholipid phosphatase
MRHRLLLPYDLPRTRWLIRGSAAWGSPRLAGATVVLSAWVLERRVSRRAAAGVLLSAGVAPATGALKRRWGPTPRFLDGGGPAPPTPTPTPTPTPNYPSGHAAFAVSVFGYLALVAARRRRPDLVALALLVPVGVGAARSLDGSHLLGEVLGGYAFGAGWLLLTVTAMTGDGRRLGASA